MTLVAIEQLEPGMTTTKNVVNQRGQVLLPKDIELSDKHIQGLRSWSVKFVDVFQGGDAIATELTNEQLLLVEQNVKRHFALNAENENDPLLETIKELYQETLIGRIPELDAANTSGVQFPEPGAAEKWLTVNHLIQNTKTLHVIPELHRKIIIALNRPEVSISEVGELITLDTSLSSRLLKMANSAYYGSNYRLNTVAKAAAKIGFDELRSFVSDSPQMTHFSQVENMNTDMHSLWIHSVAVSTFSGLIAQSVNHPDAEHLTLLGLLHDIGKLVIYQQIPEYYSSICNYSKQQGSSSMKEERKRLGFYHNLVSLELLKFWNFSKISQDIVYYHHLPENAVHKREAYIIHLSDALSHALGYNGGVPTIIPAIDPKSLAEISLKKKDLLGIIAIGQQRIEEIQHNILD